MADLVVTAGSVLYTSGAAPVKTYNAGATITAGQAIYLDSTTSTLKLAQSDGTAAEADAVGIALHAAGSGQPLAYAGNGSVINIGATTAKVHYMVSDTAGKVAPIADVATAGWRIVRLGYSTVVDGTFIVDIKNTLSVV